MRLGRWNVGECACDCGAPALTCACMATHVNLTATFVWIDALPGTGGAGSPGTYTSAYTRSATGLNPWVPSTPSTPVYRQPMFYCNGAIPLVAYQASGHQTILSSPATATCSGSSLLYHWTGNIYDPSDSYVRLVEVTITS